jgi:hypothetical protein
MQLDSDCLRNRVGGDGELGIVLVQVGQEEPEAQCEEGLDSLANPRSLYFSWRCCKRTQSQ